MTEAEKKFGYEFKNKALLKNALTHSSYANEHKVKNNERLEFLGDSVLSIIVSDYIYNNTSKVNEGILTKVRASLVCEQSLARLSEEIGLNDEIFLGKGEEATGGRQRPSVVSDAFEALLAAIYLDGGFETARKWLLNLMHDKIENALNGRPFDDYKSALQEKMQKGNTGKVTYNTISEKGQDHERLFEVEVLIDGVSVCRGSGTSKKEAEQSAARKAFEKL